MSIVIQIYRYLLAAYPSHLRASHGHEMLQLYADQLAECPVGPKRWRLHCRMAGDLLRSVPVEHYWEYRRRRRIASAMPLQRALRWVLVAAPNPAFALLFSIGVLGWGLARKSIRWREL